MKNETLIPSMSLRFLVRPQTFKESGGKYRTYDIPVLQQRFSKPGSDKPIWIDVPQVEKNDNAEGGA